MRCNKLRILCLAVLCSIFANRSVATKELTKIGAERSKDQSSNFGNSLLYLSPLALWPLNEFAVYKDLYGGWLEYFSVVGQHRLAQQEKVKVLKEVKENTEPMLEKMLKGTNTEPMLKEMLKDVKKNTETRVMLYNNIRGLFKSLRENMFEDNSEKLIDLLTVCQKKEYFEEVSQYLNDPNMHKCYYSSTAQLQDSSKFLEKIGEHLKSDALTNFKYVCDNKLLNGYMFVTYPVKSKDVNYLGLGIVPTKGLSHVYFALGILKGHLPYSSALLEKHNEFNETLTLNQDGTLNDSMLLKAKKDTSKSAEFVELGYWDLSHVEAVAKGEKNLSYLFDYIL